MTVVRDNPLQPDPGFAELFARLPDATDLEPWLTLARHARPPVLYLGAGAGRLAVPLHSKGIHLVLVDAHPAMVAHLRRRLPDVEVHQSLIETLDLGRTFDLVIVPSNILCRPDLIKAASAHLSPTGRLAFELTNPHWLAAGARPDFKVLRQDQDQAEIELEYPDGTIQQGEVQLVWPEEIENFLATAGLDLFRLSGHGDAELDESPTFYVVAGHHLPRHLKPSRLPRAAGHGR
jgi:2-polyprenyl-3-methyl-5-hydroxy-6-metoxy-1,4-benzoquinol methylase